MGVKGTGTVERGESARYTTSHDLDYRTIIRDGQENISKMLVLKVRKENPE